MHKTLDDYLLSEMDRNRVVGSWGFHSRMDFTKMGPEETNVWFFEQVFNFLRGFFGVVLPDSMEVITYNASQHIERKGLDQMTYLDELMLIMKRLKEPVWTLRLNLNLVGFLKTPDHQDRPIRLQIQEPANLIVWGGPDESGFQSFSVGYKLFSSVKLDGKDEMLWSVNQPVLEKSLRKWEDQSGHRIESTESSGEAPVHQYGFGEPNFSGI